MKLYDTAQQKVVPLPQRDPGKVSIYMCGPTVNGPPHLGHGRCVLVYDILVRYLRWSGLDVHFVSNITDIDDKIIDRAEREDRPWDEIAVKCEAIWWKAMDRLNVARPDQIPHATEYVEEMVALVEQLVSLGKAYVTGDGVYLGVEEVDGYGLLPHQNLDDLRSGGGEREIVGSEKRHPSDFALWKFVKPGEPSWPAPWGDGRPGWHTECVVMSLDLLGDGFDLHTGGLDLVFPHHENERAHAVAIGRPFAQHWMHHGFVEMGGEKMSKSIGNVKNLLDLTDQYDPRSYRLLVLQAHYRSPIEITDTTINNAVAALARLDAFARRTVDVEQAEPDAEVLDQFRSAMENDLDSAGAVDLLFRQVRDANTAIDQGAVESAAVAAATAREIAGALGLELNETQGEVPAEIQALAQQRSEARAERDFDRADELRQQLTDAGWTVEDGPDGPVVRPNDASA